MKITIDGNASQTRSASVTIGKLLSDVKNEVLESGRVVLSLCLDGRVVDSDYERQVAMSPPSSFGELTVETADPKALCLATLGEVCNHIQPIIEESARIAELIDTGREAQALGRIAPCVEVWGAIVKAVHNIAQLMQVDMESVSTGQESLSGTLRGLVELLQSIKNQLDARDLVSIRDTMKHEMPDMARRVSGQLEALSSQVATK